MPDTHLLDPMAILATLGIADATTAVPLEGGADTAIWRVERPGGPAVLRVFRTDQVETCHREMMAMRAAVAGGLPVPSVYAEGNWQGRPALLLSWCPGRPLLHELRATPSRAWALGRMFGQMHARLHAIRAPEGLSEEPDEWVTWSGPDEEPLQAQLRAVAGSTSMLLHLDYHPLNVMTDGEQITGVLDWANALAGDPRADAARTISILRLTPVRPGTLPVKAVLLRRMIERAWRHGYQEIGGTLGDMALFYGWAGAVMARDLAPRLGRPGTGIESHHLERIRRWTDHWKARVGIE